MGWHGIAARALLAFLFLVLFVALHSRLLYGAACAAVCGDDRSDAVVVMMNHSLLSQRDVVSCLVCRMHALHGSFFRSALFIVDIGCTECVVHFVLSRQHCI